MVGLEDRDNLKGDEEQEEILLDLREQLSVPGEKGSVLGEKGSELCFVYGESGAEDEHELLASVVKCSVDHGPTQVSVASVASNRKFPNK